MKYLLISLLLTKFTLLNAGIPPNLIVSTTVPIVGINEGTLPSAGQVSDLWVISLLNLCSIVVDMHIEYSGTNINVLVQNEEFENCPGPPPPIVYQKFTEIKGLQSGQYTLNYYRVPVEDIFPPDEADYPNYLREKITFEVLGAVRVDSSSNFSLLALIALMLAFSVIKIKRSY